MTIEPDDIFQLPGHKALARAALLAVTCAIAACAAKNTVDNTAGLSAAELTALCADLETRASTDCRWDLQDDSVAVQDRQTWEINCQARRDGARDTYDQVCTPERLRRAEAVRE